MKRKFKHKKLLKVNIEVIEHEWYSKFNKAYYKVDMQKHKLNTISIR